MRLPEKLTQKWEERAHCWSRSLPCQETVESVCDQNREAIRAIAWDRKTDVSSELCLIRKYRLLLWLVFAVGCCFEKRCAGRFNSKAMTNGDLGAMAESKAGASTVFVSQVQKPGKFAKASCGEFDPFERSLD